jgi:5-methylthioribose kinase
VEKIWTIFEEEFRTLWKEKAHEQFESIKEYEGDFLLRLLLDSLGYAGCEMMSRVIGLAHVHDLEIIDNQKGERLALAIGQQLVLQREAARKINNLTSLSRT